MTAQTGTTGGCGHGAAGVDENFHQAFAHCLQITLLRGRDYNTADIGRYGFPFHDLGSLAQILDAAQEDIRALAKVAKAVLAADQLCVIGGEEKIEEDKELFGDVTSF